jgi:hypothetical protein
VIDTFRMAFGHAGDQCGMTGGSPRIAELPDRAEDKRSEIRRMSLRIDRARF